MGPHFVHPALRISAPGGLFPVPKAISSQQSTPTVLTPLSPPRCGNKPFLGDVLLHYQPGLGTPLLTCQELQAKLPEANMPSPKNRSGFCTESPISEDFAQCYIPGQRSHLHDQPQIFCFNQRDHLYRQVKTPKIETILLFCDSFIMQEMAMRNDRFRPSVRLGLCGARSRPWVVRPEVSILYGVIHMVRPSFLASGASLTSLRYSSVNFRLMISLRHQESISQSIPESLN